MKLLRQIPVVLLAALLVLSTGIGVAPRALLAAPLTQTDAETIGYWQSDSVLLGDREAVLWLLLYADGSADLTSEYLDNGELFLEVAEWTENDDGTLTLSVIGTSEGDYETPFDLVFEVGDDGALAIPGAPDGIFGEAGLTFAPAELIADDATAEDATAEDAVAEDTGDATGSATDALLQDLPEDASVYQSEVMPADSGPGLQLTMVLYGDNTLELVSDNMTEGETIVEVGTWAETDEGVEITLTGLGDGSEYPDPLIFLFTLNDEGGLDLVDEGGELFGEAGLTLAPFTALGDVVSDADSVEPVDDGTAAAMTVAPAGVYVSDLLPSDEGASTFLVALLYDDTSMIITTYATDGSLPETEIGEWVDNGDGSYVLNITGTPDEEYAEPVPLDFTLEDDGSLDIFGIPLYPLEDFELAGAGDLVAEFQSEVMPAASSPGLQITLSLYDDFSATMVSDYQNDDEVVLEYAEWDVNDANQLLLTVTGQDDGDYDEPVEYVFDVDAEGVLTLAESSNDAFGSEGLTLLPLAMDDILGEMAAEDGAVEGAAVEGAAVEGAAVEGAAVEGAAVEGAAVEGAAEDVMADYTDVYEAELVVEGNDTPVLLALGFTDEGLVAIYADFQDGEEALASFGEWVDNEDGTYTLTFTEDMDGELEEPVELTVSEDDEGLLTVTDANEAGVDLLDVVFTPVDVSAE